MCTPAIATTAVLTPTPVGVPRDEDDAAVAVARLVGRQASETQRSGVGAALDRIIADHRSLLEPREEAMVETSGPNLVADLAQAIRAEIDADLLPEVSEPVGVDEMWTREIGVLSVDAIAASARTALLRTAPVHVTEEDVIVVAGALLLAVSVAHEPGSPGDDAVQVAASELDIPKPWEMTHPVLLDPVMWAVATAYHLSHAVA